MSKCSKKKIIQLALAKGVQYSDKRAVAFVVDYPGFATQDDLEHLGVKRQLNSRMERWVGRPYDPWDRLKYHGWTSNQYGGDYVKCFEFKYHNNRFNTRLYGFLCHPLEVAPAFQLFVATEVLRYKKQHGVDTAALDRVVAFSNSEEMIKGLKAFAAVWPRGMQ